MWLGMLGGLLEHCEYSQGANCYFDLARAMTYHSVHLKRNQRWDFVLSVQIIKDFEELTASSCGILNVLAQMLTLIRIWSAWPEINPAPFIRHVDIVLKADRIILRRCKIQSAWSASTDVAIFVNSLLVLRELCFEKKHILSWKF